MPKITQTHYVSDLSGAEIADGHVATVRVTTQSDPNHVRVVMCDEAEVAVLLEKGIEQGRRGRKPATVEPIQAEAAAA